MKIELFLVINFILILTNCVSLIYSSLYEIDSEYALSRDILKGYDKSIRPSVQYSTSLNITFGISLNQIIDVDERNMIITTECWLNQNWIDNKLQWDPRAYKGIEYLNLPAEKIWRPDIILSNNAAVLDPVASTNLIIKHDGNVTWLSRAVFKSSCRINVRYFPFDEQLCEIQFSSWTYDISLVNIDINSAKGDTTNYIENSEWSLVDLSARKKVLRFSCCDIPFAEIVYTVRLKRQPLFYIFNMVFPCVLLNIMAVMMFLVPPELVVNKVSTGVSALLGITVFVSMFADAIPPTSEQIPILGIYYVLTIGIILTTILFGVFTSRITNSAKSGRPVPKLIKKVFLDYIANFLGTRLYSSKSDRKDYSDFFLTQPGDVYTKTFLMSVSILLEKQLKGPTFKKILTRLDRKKFNESRFLENIMEDWMNVARAVDRLLFWAFLFLSLITGILFYFLIAI